MRNKPEGSYFSCGLGKAGAQTSESEFSRAEPFAERKGKDVSDCSSLLSFAGRKRNAERAIWRFRPHDSRGREFSENSGRNFLPGPPESFTKCTTHRATADVRSETCRRTAAGRLGSFAEGRGLQDSSSSVASPTAKERPPQSPRRIGNGAGAINPNACPFSPCDRVSEQQQHRPPASSPPFQLTLKLSSGLRYQHHVDTSHFTFTLPNS